MLNGIALADPAKATKRLSRKIGFATVISGKWPVTSQHTDETPPEGDRCVYRKSLPV